MTCSASGRGTRQIEIWPREHISEILSRRDVSSCPVNVQSAYSICRQCKQCITLEVSSSESARRWRSPHSGAAKEGEKDRVILVTCHEVHLRVTRVLCRRSPFARLRPVPNGSGAFSAPGAFANPSPLRHVFVAACLACIVQLPFLVR